VSLRDVFDVAIVGAGPAGASTAIALARAGARTLLLGGGSRTAPFGEMLPPAAAGRLDCLGVLPEFLAAGHQPTPGIVREWEDGPEQVSDFLTSPFGNGWHIDRPAFERMLRRQARTCGAVVRAARLDSFERGRGAWELMLDNSGKRHVCRSGYLLDATGRACFVARRAGARCTALDRLVGLGGIWRGDCPGRDSWGCIRAVETGWWYTAALPHSRRAAVLMTDADLIQRCGHGWRDHWKTRARSTSIGAPPASRIGFRSSCARTQWLDPPAGPGWLALGDAALARDPLSATGIVWAMDSGIRAAQAIAVGESLGYVGWVSAEREEYLVRRQYYYSVVRRWPRSDFWSRRRHPDQEVL